MKENFLEKIRELEINLELYIEINAYIINKFNLAYLNDQVIENFKNINFKLESNFDIFKNSTNYKDSFAYLSSFFYDKKVIINYSNSNEILKKRNTSLSDITSLTTYNQDNLQISSPIKSICEVNNKILVGDKNGQIHVFYLSDKEYKETYIINLNNEIKFLYPLRNNYFAASDENKIIIYGLKENKLSKKHIISQEFEYTFKIKNNSERRSNKQDSIQRSSKHIIFKHDIYYQIIELQSNYLIYIDGNTIIVLEPNFNKTYKKKGINIDLQYNIVSMAEINNNKFCVYSKDHCITIFNSHNFEKIDKIENLKYPFEKIEVLNNDIIICFGKEIKLISIIQKCQVNCKLSGYTDMCCEPKKVILAKKNKIYQFSLELNKKDFNLTKDKVMDISADSSSKINSLYISKNYNIKKEEINRKLILVYNFYKFKMYLNKLNNFEI